MNRIDYHITEAFRNDITGGNNRYTPVSRQELDLIMEKAALHKAVPIVYDYISDCDMKYEYKQHVQAVIIEQMRKTDEFLKLYEKIKEFRTAVVKGIICRSIFSKPDFRISADEDLVADKETARLITAKLVSCGCAIKSESEETDQLIAPGGLLLEVHTGSVTPCPRNIKNTLTGEISQLWTIDETEHMIYLIKHACRHFIAGGTGIRQVADIGRFADVYNDIICWDTVENELKASGINIFAANIFKIAETSLGTSPHMDSEETEPQMLLEDIMDAGIYGQSSMNRIHSRRITMSEGKLFTSVFPPAGYMKKSYGYLEKKPFLLPAAYIHRIIDYIRSTGKNKSPSESIRIGRKRTELLKKYGVLR